MVTTTELLLNLQKGESLEVKNSSTGDVYVCLWRLGKDNMKEPVVCDQAPSFEGALMRILMELGRI